MPSIRCKTTLVETSMPRFWSSSVREMSSAIRWLKSSSTNRSGIRDTGASTIASAQALLASFLHRPYLRDDFAVPDAENIDDTNATSSDSRPRSGMPLRLSTSADRVEATDSFETGSTSPGPRGLPVSASVRRDFDRGAIETSCKAAWTSHAPSEGCRTVSSASTAPGRSPATQCLRNWAALKRS